MQDPKQNIGPTGTPNAAAVGRAARRPVRWLIGLIFVMGLVVAGHATDPYGAMVDSQPRDLTNLSSTASERAAAAQLSPLERALKAEQEKLARGPVVAPAPPPVNSMSLMGFIAGSLMVALCFSMFVRSFNSNRKEQALLAEKTAELELRKKLIAEDPTLVSFFNELRFGLEISPGDTSSEKAAAPGVIPLRKGSGPPPKGLVEFYDLAPERITALRKQLGRLSRASEISIRVELIREFFWQIDELKKASNVAQLRPAWLMTCGLGGLMQQLSSTATDLNPSILRTTASALNLLEELCHPDIDPELATRTPVQLLAVDDNAVCLATLSRALKKAFHEPDTAKDGASALALAEEKLYDAIFLDVEMPGMNGFELCSKIHETPLNRATPIVFVTSHGDFESRSKSVEVGAQSLIAKPYTSFEVTVKALTLTLRGRLQRNHQTGRSSVVRASLTKGVAA